MRTILWLVFFSIACTEAQAILVDGNLEMFQGTLVRSTTHQSTKTFGALGIFANLGKENSRLYIGWYMMSVSATDDLTPSIKETLTSTDMGPAFRWGIDRGKMFSLTLVYGIQSNGKYETTGTNETLTGTSYLVKLGMEPELSENWQAGFSLNYYTANYDKRVVNNVESSPGYSNSWMFPSLSLVWKY